MRNYNVNNLYFSSGNEIYTLLDQMALIRVQFPAKYVHMKSLSEHFRVLVSYSYSNFIKSEHSIYRIKCCDCPILE